MQALSDDELAHKTVEFKERLDRGEDLNDLLVEAFAVVREAARRTIGQRHFDVQLMGGMALHFGWIAEMRTGEGKTLVSTLPVYLNALAGQGRARHHGERLPRPRDAEWMGQIYGFLGLDRRARRLPRSTTSSQKRAAYAADITYGTNTELGFDYLRDNMAGRPRPDGAARLQLRDRRRGRLDPDRRGPHPAHHLRARRTSRRGSTTSSRASCGRSSATTTTRSTRRSAPSCRPKQGIAKVERQLGVENLYDAVAVNYVHQLGKALEAKELYQRDKDYIVADGEVKIVDEFTGRILEGRRWSDGLHQAVEAKERVRIHEENHTWATVTLQNYFRMYEKLAGMTGTAETEAAEFASTYELAGRADPDEPADGPRRRRRPHLQDRGRASSTRSSRTSSSATRRASRSSSAPPRSRSPSSSRGCWTNRASRTPC